MTRQEIISEEIELEVLIEEKDDRDLSDCYIPRVEVEDFIDSIEEELKEIEDFLDIKTIDDLENIPEALLKLREVLKAIY